MLKDIRFMLNYGLGIYWKFTWTIFIPVALSVIFIYAMVTYKPLETSKDNPFPVAATGMAKKFTALFQFSTHPVPCVLYRMRTKLEKTTIRHLEANKFLFPFSDEFFFHFWNSYNALPRRRQLKRN